MATGTQTITEVREQETSYAIKWVAIGTGILLVALFMVYFLGVILKDNPGLLTMMRVGMGLGALAGGAVIIGGFYRLSQLRNLRSVSYPCPYCDAANQLVAAPTTDFECETCHQTVRFDSAGKMLPVKIISCPNCNTDNRISAKSSRFICNKCNATVQVQAEQPVYGMGLPTQQTTQRPAAAPSPAMLLNQPHPQANFDVLIQAFDRSRQAQLVQSLENILGVEATEARRLLETITDRTPLIVGVDMPLQAAEPLQAQLSQLGARVQMRSR